MMPLLLQVTIPLFLQGCAALVGLCSFFFVVYTNVKNWNTRDKEAKEAIRAKEVAEFKAVQKQAEENAKEIAKLKEDANAERTRRENRSTQEASDREKIVAMERSTELMKQLFTESQMRNDTTIGAFLEYAKVSNKTNEAISQMQATFVQQEKWMGKYLEAMEKKIDETSGKIDLLQKDVNKGLNRQN